MMMQHTQELYGLKLIVLVAIWEQLELHKANLGEMGR